MVDKIKEVYKMLEDEQSKEIYLARLNYLVTGDFKYLGAAIEKWMPHIPLRNNKEVSDLIQSLPEDRKIILYGAGDEARLHLSYWEKDERFAGLCDRDLEKQENGFYNYPVISPEDLLKMEDVTVVISTHAGEREIKNFLEQSRFPADRVFAMSNYIYCIDPDQYFNPDFMSFEKEGEVFVDAGCKNLNTSLTLSKLCNLKKVYAFEPDKHNYQDCIQREKEFTGVGIEIFPFGVWSESKTLHFSATADGSSHICEDGEVSVEVMAIDEAVSGKDRVTFIKMDVEGSELESLKGAKNTILRDRPKLAICIYHKMEDMVEIPIYIKGLVPEYKLYVRHHSNGSGETVLYAVMP